MNIWTFSDLHLEFGDPFNTDPPKDVDVVVCAGDVLTRGVTPSIKWLAKNVARTVPVVFVAGNHEFYNASINESMREVERGSGFQNLHFLENDAVEIGGVVFAVRARSGGRDVVCAKRDERLQEDKTVEGAVSEVQADRRLSEARRNERLHRG
ncbi:metallophosphoesterase [Rhizobium leguminosarum]|uniref:metallophosphoesterase family protein n=1 Tax=Rhizobium leguminosarum TaxID=384 RepID=UPI0028F44A07|nr:metallophosphoesterase [Rhizobium leguminosarum]